MWVSRRWFWVPVVLQSALGITLCFVPLFDLLSYEYAFATTLLAAPLSLWMGLGVSRQIVHRVPTPWLTIWLFGLLHLVPSLVAISLNAYRVQNCDYREGLLFFLALPAATTVYATTLGVTVGKLFDRRRDRILASIAVLVVPLAGRLWELYSEPQIFVFDHLYGHFAGSLYDETVTLDARMVWLRLGTALRIGVALWAVRLVLWDRGWPRVAFAVGLFVGMAALYDAQVGSRTGFRLDRADIERVLSKTVRREGLVVHVPADTPDDHAARIANHHVFWLEELRGALGVEGPEVVHAYVYADRDQKARLMGGRSTMVAKPWLGEIHVHGREVPHDIVPHELVHVLAAELGSPPFGVTAHLGVFVDMGIVEGLAESLTPPRGDYGIHQWVRALRVLDRAPDVRRLVAVTDFWRAPPARAYTVMGSFIRYLLDTRGPKPIRELYRTGDFRAALGEDLEQVVSEWERFIDGLSLTDRERRAAEERFRARSIFARVCAHEVAQLREAARTAPGDAAILYYERVAEFLGGSADARYDLALATLGAGDEARFRELAHELLSSGELRPFRATELRERLGQLAWREGHIEEARQSFRAALENPSSLASERLQWVRIWALDRAPAERDFLEEFLRGAVPRPSAVLELERLRRAHPDDPTLPYLLARQLYQGNDPRRALALLGDTGTHPFLPIEAERIRLIAELLETTGDLRGAADAFDAVARILPRSGEAARMAARAAWLRWERQHRP